MLYNVEVNKKIEQKTNTTKNAQRFCITSFAIYIGVFKYV